MKTTTLPPLHRSLFSQENVAHPVKVIKAEQAINLLSPTGNGSCETGKGSPRKNPEVRLVATGPDYCDLEVVCGCGDTTRFRCWNTPSTDEKGTK
jgi:hypothetical protein